MSAMSRSLLPWLTLSVVVLAAVLLFVRDDSRGDIGLDVDVQRETSSGAAFELAGAAETDREQRVGERRQSATASDRAIPIPHSFPVFKERRPFDGGVIEVRVVHDEDGRPFVGARVMLPVGFNVSAVAPPQPLTTDAQGLARFEGLLAWDWNVVAEADGCIAERGSALIQEQRPEARVELRLATRRDVLVRFVDASGRDLVPADLGLEADDVRGVGLVLDACCGEPGQRFQLVDAPSHRARGVDTKQHPFCWNLEIRGVSAACVHALLGDVILAAEPLDPRATDVLVRLDREVVARAATPIVVRVVAGAAEEPVVGARVVFSPVARKAVERLTDDEGRARVEGLVTGELGVSASAPGFALARIAVRRPIEGELVLRMTAGRTISGVVFDQLEAAMPRALVGIYSADEAGSNRVTTPLEFAFTDLDGRFVFTEQKVGEYVVGVHASDGRRRLPKREELRPDTAFVDCRDADVTGLVLHGYRPVNDLGGPDWDLSQLPR